MRYDVAMQRPDKLRVIIPGDGPASEFYYDGKSMMAYAPAENLVAVADAPPTIDGTLKAAFEAADIYYPFTDLLVADPYAAMADGAILAFYIGPSGMVGDTKTEMLAWANPRGVPADLDRRRRQAAAPRARGLQRRSAGLAPSTGSVELADRCGDPSGRVHVGEGQERAADEVRPAGARVRAARPEAAWERKAVQGCYGPAGREVTMIRGDVMKTIVAMAGALLLGVLWQDPAGAWSSANRYGGSTSHSEGETSHTNAYGGSSSHSYGRAPSTPMPTVEAASTHTEAERSTPTPTAAARMARMAKGPRTPIRPGRRPITPRFRGLCRISRLSPACRGPVLLGIWL